MGQLPLRDERPALADERYSSQGGSVTRNGLILTFRWLMFRQVFDGAPAFADWLCSKGCIDMRYDLQMGGGLDEAGED